jgi:predicted metal-dependent peptidase
MAQGVTTTKQARQARVKPTDPKLDAKVVEKLITARIALLLKSPFYGNLATRLILVNADEWCPTAATDGRNFYYNTEFVNMLSQKEVEFLFGHELLHCVYDHLGRRTERHDPRLSNAAQDYVVNADLIKQRVGERITKVPILYDAKYEGMSWEEVYDLLYENAEKIDMDQLMDQILDEHLDDDDGEGSGDSEGNGDKKGKCRPKLSAEERQQIKDEMKAAVLQAAQAVGAGNLPSGVKRMIDSMTNPKMNWRELIRQQIQATLKSDFTWARPSRRGWHMDAVLPGMKPGEQIDICVAIDMSGSISSEQARDFLTEIKGITDQFEEYRLHVLSFDTSVYNPQVFTSDSGEDIGTYQPHGGGGTMFECVWDYLKEQGIEPKKLVFFTDGYPCGSWGDPDYCDTIFVVHGNDKIVAPFGQTAHYDQAADLKG